MRDRYQIVRSREAKGRRASHWCTYEAAEDCAATANATGILFLVDQAVPATPWAVVDTGEE